VTVRLPTAIFVAALCCATTLAGCSADGPGPPTVPAIQTQKGLVGLDPCALLDQGDRMTLGLGTGVPGQDELGANCRWAASREVEVRLTSYTGGGGLTDLTAEVDPAASRVRLSGYPALETFTVGGRFCRYDVGVADEQAIVATMAGGEPDSCTALQKLLIAVLSRLPVRE
jgi:uncharacterized protein DUF3558